MMRRVLFPDGEWIPFRNEIFEQFGKLKERNAAAVYAVLYDRAFHSRTGAVRASFSDIARWTNLEARSVKKCLAELLDRKLVRKSKSRKRTWKVPLAKFDLRNGDWTPVPRLLIREYIACYPNAVLLLLILRIQSRKQLNYCWATSKGLGEMINWSESRTRTAMQVMSDDDKWKARNSDIPRPLSWWKHRETEEWRHRVRAIRYVKGTTENQWYVRLSTLFGEAFNLPVLSRKLN